MTPLPRAARKTLAAVLSAAILVSAPGPFAVQAFAQVMGRAGAPAGAGTMAVIPVTGMTFEPLSAPALTAGSLAAPSLLNAAPVPGATAMVPSAALAPAALAARPVAAAAAAVKPVTTVAAA